MYERAHLPQIPLSLCIIPETSCFPVLSVLSPFSRSFAAVRPHAHSQVPAMLELALVLPSPGGRYPGLFLFTTPARYGFCSLSISSLSARVACFSLSYARV